MHHLLEHINQDIKRRLSKDKDSTVNKTEYRSKRNPTGKPRWAWQQPKHQAPTISSRDKSLSRNRHGVIKLILNYAVLSTCLTVILNSLFYSADLSNHLQRFSDNLFCKEWICNLRKHFLNFLMKRNPDLIIRFFLGHYIIIVCKVI